jgi:hypothetical protein
LLIASINRSQSAGCIADVLFLTVAIEVPPQLRELHRTVLLFPAGLPEKNGYGILRGE